MKKKMFLGVGMVTLFLFATISFTGCEMNPDFDYEIVMSNQSSFTIRVRYRPEYRVSPMSFTLNPGAQRTARTNHSWVHFDWYRTDTGNQAGVIYVNDHPVRGGTFRNW